MRLGKHCSMRAGARQSGQELLLLSACRRQFLQKVCWQHGKSTGLLSSSRQIGHDSAKLSSSSSSSATGTAGLRDGRVGVGGAMRAKTRRTAGKSLWFGDEELQIFTPDPDGLS